ARAYVLHRRTVLWHRPHARHGLKRLSCLVRDQVRERLHQLLTFFHQVEHRFFGLDHALLAREAADVATGAAVRAERVDERARTVVRAERALGLFVVDRLVAQLDRCIETDERALAATLDHAQ